MSLALDMPRRRFHPGLLVLLLALPALAPFRRKGFR